jgi:SulP family sulfate permease
MRSSDLVPGVGVLRGYRREWLRGDVLAGVTVAAYLIPQVMAYAQIAGLPPVAGLWAILGPLAVYAVFGSSRQLSVGPESTSALMTAAGVAALVGAAGADRYAEVAALLALAVGVLCLIGFLGRLGFLADLLSKPVLVGYMAGIAVLMIVSQLGKTTRVDVEGETLVAEVGSFVGQLGDVHLPTLAVALTCLVVLFVLRWISPLLPGPLIVIVLAAAAVWALGLADDGIRVIGEMPRGLPTPRLPDLTSVDVLELLPAALGIALVAYSDNVLTARAFADRKRQRIDTNQEFLALGVANLSSGLLQGFPVSSSGSRTVLGDAMGSRTQVYSLVALAGVVVTMFLLAPALAWFPTAALGAVVVYAAIRLVDVAEMRRIARYSRMEITLAAATTAAVLFMGLLPGIGLAVALSIVDLLRRLTRPHDGVLGYIPGKAGMHDLDDYDTGSGVPGLLVYRYDAPLFFANAEDFRSRALRAVDDSRTPPHWFLLNAETTTQLDLTAVDALETLRHELADRGIEFAIARAKFEIRESLEAGGILEKVGPDRVFDTLPTAVAAFSVWHAEREGRPTGPFPPTAP